MKVLKIEKNFNLKQLAKFGFIETETDWRKEQNRFGVDDEAILIDKKCKTISWGANEDLLDLDFYNLCLFELITAGIIVLEEEEKWNEFKNKYNNEFGQIDIDLIQKGEN